MIRRPTGSTLFPNTTLFRSKGIRLAPKAADRLLRDVQGRDVAAYRHALAVLADLEVDLRGGGGAAMSEDTAGVRAVRSEEHTSELQSRQYLVCRLLLEKKKS